MRRLVIIYWNKLTFNKTFQDFFLNPRIKTGAELNAIRKVERSSFICKMVK